MSELSGFGAATAQYIENLTELHEANTDPEMASYIGKLTKLLDEVKIADAQEVVS